MIRRPPRSTLFPTRRSSDLTALVFPKLLKPHMRSRSPSPLTNPPPLITPMPVIATRSEEHTSELQSRQYLVCRLLLEKKKKAKKAKKEAESSRKNTVDAGRR